MTAARASLAVLLVLVALAALPVLPAPAAAQPTDDLTGLTELTVQILDSEGDPLAGGVTVGDPVIFRVEIRHPEDARVEVESSMTELGSLDAALPEIELVESGRTAVAWRSAAFRVGTFEVALPPIVVVSNAGSTTLTPPLQRVEVISALPGGSAEPRPITPPQELEGGSGFAFWIAALLAVAAGFILARALGLRARRRSAPDPNAAAPNAAPSPALPDLNDATLPAEFCRELAVAVRAHLARRYDIPAQSLTSAELPEHLAAASAPAAAVQRVRTLLRECDAATFADQTPPPERLAGYRQLAAAIIASDRETEAEADSENDPGRP